MPDPATIHAGLRSLLRPRRIAIVGASEKSYFTQVAVENLTSFGFGDRLNLVNRRGVEICGLPSVPSLADVDEPIDLAFLMVPAAGTFEALSEAAAVGIRSAVVLSSGWSESGESGRESQRRLVAHAQSLGITVLGPNNLGFANFVDGIAVTTIPSLPRTSGGVALLSQSGASSSAMMDFAACAGVGLSYLVTLGNEAMVTAGHVLDHLVDDEATRAVAIFMETVREPEVFRRAARRALAAGKPVVVLKAGRSALAARTAAAHTGALVGDDRTTSAVFRELGVIRVNTIEDMLVTAGAGAHLGRLARPGIGVVSISGGACDVVADLAHDADLALPAPTAATREALGAVVPSWQLVPNPLDLTGAAVLNPSLFTSAVDTLAHDPHIGAVLVITKLPWQDSELPFRGQPFIDAIGVGVAAAPIPVVLVNQVMQPITPVSRAVMQHAGVPYAICGLAQAVSTMAHLGRWSQHPARNTTEPGIGTAPLDLPPADERHGAWSEHRARELLAATGVPVIASVLAATAREAVDSARAVTGPVAVKLVAAQVLHKSDIGGVRLAVRGDDEVRAAFEAVTAAGRCVDGAFVEGALVSPMREGGVELLVGVARDPQWGLVLAVALGGVFVEVLHDAALAPLPVSAARARELLGALRGSAVLDGVRGRPAVDLDVLAGVIARIAALATALGDDLESLEVNPLRVDGTLVEALDAVITWRERSDGGTA